MVCGQKVVHVLRSIVLDEPQVPLGNGMVLFLKTTLKIIANWFPRKPTPAATTCNKMVFDTVQQVVQVLLPTKQALILGVRQFERSHIHNAQNTLDQNATNQTLACSTVSVCLHTICVAN